MKNATTNQGAVQYMTCGSSVCVMNRPATPSVFDKAASVILKIARQWTGREEAVVAEKPLPQALPPITRTHTHTHAA